MIKSFKTRETEKIFSRQRSAQIPEEVQRIALRNLRTLDRAAAVQDDWLPASNGSADTAVYEDVSGRHTEEIYSLSLYKSHQEALSLRGKIKKPDIWEDSK